MKENRLFRVVNQYLYWYKGESYGILEVEDTADKLTHYFSSDPSIRNAADCIPGIDVRGMGHLGMTLEEAIQKIENRG